MDDKLLSQKIRFTVEDGRVYELAALLVAENRADYYASRDPDTTFNDELEYSLTDHDELIDWAVNNMNWDDVAYAATLVENGTSSDPGESWTCSDNFEVV